MIFATDRPPQRAACVVRRQGSGTTFRCCSEAHDEHGGEESQLEEIMMSEEGGHSVWQQLGSALLDVVFRFVGERSFGSIRLVCRAWAEALTASVRELQPVSDSLPPRWGWSARFAHLRSLDLSGSLCTEAALILADLPIRLEHLSLPPLVADSELSALRCLPNLVYLDIASCELLSGRGVATLFARGCFPGLKALDISGGHLMNTAGVEDLFQCLPSTLTYLDMSAWDDYSRTTLVSSPSALQRLLWPASLERLVLDGSGVVGDSDLRRLRSMHGLTSLTLSGCHHLSDTGLADLLRATTQLTELNLSECVGVGRRTVAAISQLTRLEELDLSGCAEIGWGELSAHLPCLDRLRYLSLNDTHTNDEDMMSMQGLTNLTSLGLAGCSDITSGGATVLKKLCRLNHLNFSGGCNRMSHRNLQTIGHLRSLTSLELADCPVITEQGLFLLAGLSNLRLLDLSWCHGMSNRAITCMRPLSALTSLNLSHCVHVSDAGIACLLRHHRRLSYLGLVGCLGISDQIIGKLRAKPGILIEVES